MTRSSAVTAVLAAAVAVGPAAAAKAAPASITIEDIAIDYDGDLWRVDVQSSPVPPDASAADARLLAIFNCVGRGCREDTAVFVSIAPAGRDAQPPGTFARDDADFTQPLWDDGLPARNINDLTVFAGLTFSGCRALSPSALRAETEHAGNRYRFASGMALGCGGAWSVGQRAFLDLISGIRPAD